MLFFIVITKNISFKDDLKSYNRNEYITILDNTYLRNTIFPFKRVYCTYINILIRWILL